MEEIRDENFEVVIPIVVFSVFTMTAGTLGNCLVLYIYKFKYKQSNHRYFILCLAVCDLTSSLIGVPFLIAEMTLTYLKICKANGKQMSYNNARNMCYVSIILGILFSLPSALLYGHNTVHTEINNITVLKCHYLDTYKNHFLPLMYQSFLALWFIAGMSTVCACYSQIVCRIKTQNVTQSIICQCTRTSNLMIFSDDVSGRSNQNTLTRTVISYRRSNSATKAYRLAKMLFIIAAVFLCSYIPYFAVSLVNIAKTNFLRSLSPVETSVIVVCYKSFLINYFANPIVYAILDGAFRAECQNLFSRIIKIR
ncbi:hypothetical protein ACJMK2_032617 [Sinanodonta woodiana]|uniref:G-protein coupled receptors family 1 profile domain-containing protein n=1 Tax=Sinanodonta woodiana TaxID=1069815 RepID=A0ABD3X5V7_SINWO